MGLCSTQPNQVKGVANKVTQWQHGELIVVHVIRHDCIHLTTTVGQSVALPVLQLETYQGFWTHPMCSQPTGDH